MHRPAIIVAFLAIFLKKILNYSFICNFFLNSNIFLKKIAPFLNIIKKIVITQNPKLT